MTKKEALDIICVEKLTNINWFNEDNPRENEVGIRKTLEGWEVYITGERAEIISGTECKFINENDAYDALIRKARYVKKIFG